MKQSEYILAGALATTLLLLLFPINPLMLDLMLALNLVLAVMVLFATITVSETLEFSTFPSVLLILTLFRLALNLASTRLILAKGEAGAIISTFGNVVTSGSTMIGFVLFALLTLINFIVITKGAGRIAEVAARFTLEALPGKQSAIETELSSGIINVESAKEIRQKIQATAEFYGAMDGASKFVRGDAIASIIITGVNIMGGVLVGMISGHLSLQECFSTYVRLTIGDGLVTQIPALIISLSGALIVTRASSGSLAPQILHQLFSHKKVIVMGACTLLLLSLLPGMPKAVLLLVGSLLLFVPRFGKKKESERVKEQTDSYPAIEILLGRKMLLLAEDLLPAARQIRDKLTARLGFKLPSFDIKDNLRLPEEVFQIKIKGACIYEGKGDFTQVLATTEGVILSHAHELLNRQDLTLMLERAKVSDQAVVDELIPKKLQLGDLLKIIQNLLREKFIISDIVTVLETIANHLPRDVTPDCDLLTEFVRQKLARSVFEEMLGEKKELFAITLDPKVEQMLSACIKKSPYGTSLALRPVTLDKIGKELEYLMENAKRQNLKAVVLTTAGIRAPLSQLLETRLLKPAVFSYEEITPGLNILPFGSISNEVLI